MNWRRLLLIGLSGPALLGLVWSVTNDIRPARAEFARPHIEITREMP